MTKVKVEDVLESIEAWTVLDLNKLVKGIEEKFGVSAAAMAPVAVAAQPGAAQAGGAAAAQEQTAFEVILAEVGDKKIQVIKELRTMTTLGLQEAKDLVDAAPKTIKTGATKEEAQAMKEKLEAAGAKVQLK